MTESTESKRALVIGAHPDDNEFGAGGTSAKLAAQGWDVTFIIVTNGNKGSHDPGISPYQLSEIREQEQRAAAAVLGVKRVIFLRNNDGELEPTFVTARRDRAVHPAFQAASCVHARSVEALHAAPRPSRGRLCHDRGHCERARPPVHARPGPDRHHRLAARGAVPVERRAARPCRGCLGLCRSEDRRADRASHAAGREPGMAGARAPAHGRARPGARLRGRRELQEADRCRTITTVFAYSGQKTAGGRQHLSSSARGLSPSAPVLPSQPSRVPICSTATPIRGSLSVACCPPSPRPTISMRWISAATGNRHGQPVDT